ncbi:unnamed protein product [Symbiodinium pilosum]|uniref:Uncharacterized protein n=1 Tax=Symbiodinium pilosum TaxID=2952 RepID=A0A812RH92_SYMPI|nr:unnamed protein product [Symbiodinium pilosum]
MAVALKVVVFSCLPLARAGWYVGTSGARQDCNAVCAGIGPCNAKALNDMMQCSQSQLKAFLVSIATTRRINDAAGIDQTAAYNCSRSISPLADPNGASAPMANADGHCGYTTGGTATCSSQPPVSTWVRHCCCEEYEGDCEARQSTTSLIVTMVWTSNSEDEAGAGMGPELQALLVTLGIISFGVALVCCLYGLLYKITMCRLKQLGDLDPKSQLPL